MCLFCEAYDGKRQIADWFLTNGQRVDISVAIVERYLPGKTGSAAAAWTISTMERAHP